MPLYVYCLSNEVTTDTIQSVVGLADAKPRLIEHAGLKAVVSDFKDEPVAVTRENVLAHEGVVRRVLAETTPLPFRFGTLISETRLESYLDSQQDSLRVQLERVRGCVEMSVKVIWKLETVRDEALRQAEGSVSSEAKQKPAGKGAMFLETKRREMLGDEALKRRAEEIADWLNDSLVGTVREKQASVQPMQSLVLSAAHLVERVHLKEYRAAIHRAQKERGELHFLTSGTWPPYSFTNISA
ncbi:MAG TPA: GvpL/GvpF family gas vesicle protein [Pyrinomonadaceae bacterium]